MTILVTGAAGFIGSNLCEDLLKRDNTVIGVDNFDNYYPRKFKQLNLSFISSNTRFYFHETDIRDKKRIEEIFSTIEIDAVIHLAAKAGVRPSIENAGEYYDVNLNGSVCLLDAMKKYGVKKMLFASSSSVYGNSKIVPFSEKNSVDNPISPYASTKKSGELLCHVYHHLYGFDITCLRFFTVYGPRQRPDLAIHKFTELIFSDKPVPFYGDGSTARDYTFIDDIVKGIGLALEHLNGFRIYNLGGTGVVDLKTMLSTIEKSLGKKAKLNILPPQPGDVNITYADISSANAEIGYSPVVSFQEGIRIFTDWYLRYRDYLYGNQSLSGSR
ncbi:MAG: SDR family NAD(P)-dependent oxidoreductase [Bacteroidales bacterium]|nr:SDR family NAD(P)-dependent oxidoreductase [Bacteroidales bacterium]